MPYTSSFGFQAGKFEDDLGSFRVVAGVILDEYHWAGFVQFTGSAEGRNGIVNVLFRLPITAPGSSGSALFALYSVSVMDSSNVAPCAVSQAAVQAPSSHAQELIATVTFLSFLPPGASRI